MIRYASLIYNATVNTQCNGFPLDEAVDIAATMVRQTDRIFLIGNGGSLAACDHMANDMCLAGINAMSLSNASNMACIANDFGFQDVFKRQLDWYMKQKGSSLIIALSCSGKSANIIDALQNVRNKATVITFSGFSEANPLRSLGNLNFYVPSNSYGVVQLAHEALLHCVIDKIAGIY